MTVLAASAFVVLLLVLCVYPRPRSGARVRRAATPRPARRYRLMTCAELRRRGMAMCQACHLGEHWHCESPEVV